MRPIAIVFALLAPALAAQTSAPGPPPAGPSAPPAPASASGCRFAWFLSIDEDRRLADYAGMNEQGLSYPMQTLSEIVGREGTLFAGTPWCSPIRTWYRFQSCPAGLPDSRAEAYASTAVTRVPARETRGELLFDVWLIDENPGCVASSEFRGLTKPSTVFDVARHVGSSCSVQASVQVELSETYSLTRAADNALELDFEYDTAGASPMISVSLQVGTRPAPGRGIGLGPSVGLSVSSSPPQTESVLPNQRTYRAPIKDSGWVHGVANAMSLWGRVQTQLQADASSSGSGIAVVHVHLYGSDHGARSLWHASPTGISFGGTPGYGGSDPGRTTPPAPPGGSTPRSQPEPVAPAPPMSVGHPVAGAEAPTASRTRPPPETPPHGGPYGGPNGQPPNSGPTRRGGVWEGGGDYDAGRDRRCTGPR